ncbi:hypothetical protein RSP03_44490 [Cereibacter sphaeroides]|nr:hypothetical protein RSP03_44490 [Cereibacter sphaeroides]
MAYPPERKAAVLTKMLPPNNMPLGQLAKEEGISVATLAKWRAESVSVAARAVTVHAALGSANQTASLVAWPPFFDRRLVPVRRALRKVALIITVFGTAASAATSDKAKYAATNSAITDAKIMVHSTKIAKQV